MSQNGPVMELLFASISVTRLNNLLLLCVGRACHQEVGDILDLALSATETDPGGLWPSGYDLPSDSVHDLEAAKPAKKLQTSAFEPRSVIEVSLGDMLTNAAYFP